MKKFFAWAYAIVVSIFAGWTWFKTPTIPTSLPIPSVIERPTVAVPPLTTPAPRQQRQPRRTTLTPRPRTPVVPAVTQQCSWIILPIFYHCEDVPRT